MTMRDRMLLKPESSYLSAIKLHLTLLALCCLVIISFILVPQKLTAATWSCKGSGFEVDTPDNWSGAVSSSKIKLESLDYDELLITIQAKKSSKRIGGNQIMSMFKKRWASIKKEYPKSTVILKPQKSAVGEFKAIRYSFRYKNFINVVMDETTIWFNAQKNETNLKSKIHIIGPAKDMRVEGGNIEGIVASFRFIADEESSMQASNTDEDSWTTPSQTTEQTGYDQGNSATSNPVTATYVASNTEESTSNFPKRRHRVKRSKRTLTGTPAGLMSNARLVTDPDKIAKYEKTFLDRNTVRTAEQKARARAYSGGFRNAQVEE